jgi:hypothetical protein
MVIFYDQYKESRSSSQVKLGKGRNSANGIVRARRLVKGWKREWEK